MSDDKLRCAIVYRLEGTGPTAVTLAQLDYLKQVTTHGSDEEDLYGGKKANFAKAVARVVGNDPPTGVSKGQKVGGFKVVQSDEHQVVYGADIEGICKCHCCTVLESMKSLYPAVGIMTMMHFRTNVLLFSSYQGYCVITGLKYPNRIAIKFLEELGAEFQSTIGHAEMKKAKENSLTTKKDSKKILQALCKKFESPQSADKTHKVLAQVDKVKEQMQDNISGMMKNQESAESLNEKSAQLSEQASVFKTNAKTLKKAMWWKNMKTTLCLACVCIVVVILISIPIIINVTSMAQTVTWIGGGGQGEAKIVGGDAGEEIATKSGGRRLWSVLFSNVNSEYDDDGADMDYDKGDIRKEINEKENLAPWGVMDDWDNALFADVDQEEIPGIF
jgi:vesicle-associated membrane protein 7